jgi:2-polyprenyl-3-methyl-5-hydroxy-6-metoxy-1,4-benzoquinol methylase
MKTSEELINLNEKQKEFYNTKKRNFATRMWAKVRDGLLTTMRKTVGVQEATYEKHREWLGDLNTKKVLDLGCFEGNHWTQHMASHSKSYLGLDLSDMAIAKLNERLKSYPNAEARAGDFLSDADFPETGFDVIYAYGVLHHFKDVDVLIQRLDEKLAPNGMIISYDPLQTSVPLRILRAIYRPFQSDKEWEWPFNLKTYRQFEKAFVIEERHGILGKSKWYFLMGFLPLSNKRKEAIGKRWHQEDWEVSAVSDRRLFQCMHLTMKMKKRHS